MPASISELQQAYEYIEREMNEMKEAHKLLEARVWKIVVGGQFLTILAVIVGLLLK